MRYPSNPTRFLPAVFVAVVIWAAGIAAVALAGSSAEVSKSARLKVRCPSSVTSGRKVTCKVLGQLPRGPRGLRGLQGPRGQRGAKGEKGARGPAGSAGVSGYEIVSQTFKEVFIENSGTPRGLSEVKTVDCPGGKRVISGGADLGTNTTQNGQQRQVTVSLSGPNGAGTGWSAQLFNNSVSVDTSIDLKVYAICASVG